MARQETRPGSSNQDVLIPYPSRLNLILSLGTTDMVSGLRRRWMGNRVCAKIRARVGSERFDAVATRRSGVLGIIMQRSMDARHAWRHAEGRVGQG